MYKTKVQELCQRRSWTLPTYETTREGSDHNPRFTSTVTVNGVSFLTPSPTRTAKQAQNDAAMLAFLHFSPPSPSPSTSYFPQHSLSISALSSFPQPSLCPSSSGSADPSSVVDDILPTNEVLQLKLEEVCQTSQATSPGPVLAVGDTITAEDQKNMLHLYKNQLQSYVQKKSLSLPVYSSEWEGPPHAMRFKCKVTVDGQTYESDKFYSTLKDAEHAAAEVALMSLSPDGVQEGHVGLYKNLLQELAQKEGFHLPIYNTNKSGEAHMPIFVSQVVVEGELFTGQEAKSKKQAEISAAKMAYMALKERKGKSDQRSLFPLSVQTHEFSPDCSKANVITGLQHHANPKSPVSPGLVKQNQPNKVKGKSDQRSLFPLSVQTHEFSPDCSEANVITGLQHHANPKSPVSPGLVKQNQPNKVKGKSDQRSLFPLSVQTHEFSPDCSEANVITGLQHHANPKSPVIPGFVKQNQPNKVKGKSDKSSSFSFSTHKGQAPEFSSDHSESNVVTDPQYNANPNSLVDSGLVIWNQHSKHDKLKKNGNTNGCTEDFSLSNDKSASFSHSGITKVVSDSNNTSTSSPCAKRVLGYSRKTNMKIEEGGTILPFSDDKWVAYSYSH